MKTDFLQFLKDECKSVRYFTLIQPQRTEKLHGPHIHTGWEVKFLEKHTVEAVPPGVVHASSHGGCRASFLCDGTHFTLQIGTAFPFLNANAGEYGTLLTGTLSLCRTTPPGAAGIQHSLFASAMLILKELVSHVDKNPVGNPAQNAYRRSIDFLLHEYHRPELSVFDLSEVSGYSIQYLNRIFHQNGGKSIRQELLRIRMEHARLLLQSGKYLVSDAARITGWRNPFYFSSIYKKYYGMSPSATLKGIG